MNTGGWKRKKYIALIVVAIVVFSLGKIFLFGGVFADRQYAKRPNSDFWASAADWSKVQTGGGSILTTPLDNDRAIVMKYVEEYRSARGLRAYPDGGPADKLINKIDIFGRENSAQLWQTTLVVHRFRNSYQTPSAMPNARVYEADNLKSNPLGYILENTSYLAPGRMADSPYALKCGEDHYVLLLNGTDKLAINFSDGSLDVLENNGGLENCHLIVNNQVQTSVNQNYDNWLVYQNQEYGYSLLRPASVDVLTYPSGKTEIGPARANANEFIGLTICPGQSDSDCVPYQDQGRVLKETKTNLAGHPAIQIDHTPTDTSCAHCLLVRTINFVDWPNFWQGGADWRINRDIVLSGHTEADFALYETILNSFKFLSK